MGADAVVMLKQFPLSCFPHEFRLGFLALRNQDFPDCSKSHVEHKVQRNEIDKSFLKWSYQFQIDTGGLMDKAYFIDKLTRASQMEEEMAGLLIGAIEADQLLSDLAPEARDRISVVLKGIHEDTLRHRQTAQDLIAVLSRGK